MHKIGWLASVAVWICLTAVPSSVYGSGFALFEAGARGSALAGAMTARADDPAAIFYNPAGLVQVSGFQVMGGVSFIIPRVEVVTNAGGAGGVEAPNLMESHTAAVPHFFTSDQLGDKVWLGLGLNSPFGLGIKYNDLWVGGANVIKADIATLNLNPTVAVKITDHISAGAGLDLMYFNFDMKRILPLPFIGPQSLHVEGDTWGLGFNAGLHLKPRDNLSLGISYRSQVREQVNGPAQFQPYSTLNAPASGSVILPDMIFTGIMFRPLEKFSVEVGTIWTHWSLFRNFNVKFDNPLGTLSERKSWHDTWRGQVGVEYRALPWLDLRTGYAMENEPMPDRYVDYLVPSFNVRHNFTFGTGFRWQAMTIDLAYSLVYMPDRTVNTSVATGVLPSTFQGRLSHVFVCSLGYKF